MATLTKGRTWVNGEQITSTRLNQLVDNATIANIVRADMKTSEFSGVSISNSAPGSPVAGELWFDSSLPASQGKIRYYNGAHWVPIAEGFLAYNTSGGTIAAGALIKLSFSASGTANLRQEITPTTSIHDYPAGMALQEILNGSTGVVVTRGRVLTLTKATGKAVTAGDSVVPSATSGQAMSGSTTSYSPIFGSSAIGIWTKDEAAGATSGEAYLWGPQRATWTSFRSPTKVMDAVAGVTNATWSGSLGTPNFVPWSETPPGVIARLIQVRVTADTATAETQIAIAFRQAGSGLTIATGAPHIVARTSTDNGVAADELALSGQLWIQTDPAGDGNMHEETTTDLFEYFIDTNGTITDVFVTVHELAVMTGGTNLV